MGGGTGTEHARRHEEPAVDTETSLTGDLEVDLDPEDVWTLGQLIEAGAVSFPPGVAEELMTGYRILQASGYEPPEDAQTNVQLRGSGEASGIELPVEGEAELTARRVILTEIATEDDQLDEEGDMVEPGVDVDRREASPDRRDGHPQATLHPEAVAAAGEGTQRLADAVEDLRDAIADWEPGVAARPAADAETQAGPRQDGQGALVLDWALIGLGLGVSTTLVLAAAVIADPVFAVLGIALLVMCVFQAIPYLVEESGEEGLP